MILVIFITLSNLMANFTMLTLTLHKITFFRIPDPEFLTQLFFFYC